MFDQVAKRDFIVRRGRNNRILINSIMKNVFDDKLEEEYKMPDPIMGQRHYVEKYNKVWGKQCGQKRLHRDGSSELAGRGRKRVKFSNQEICYE